MTDADPLPISALQHWMYCPRQCALIHQEQVFAENVHTLRGQAVHRTVDTPGLETRAGLRIERSLPLWCDTLGLAGKADVVEFDSSGNPYPVEYKHGSRHKAAHIARCDDVQLAAQAMCLESMTGHTVPEGAIYYARSKKRRVVSVNEDLRQQVAETVNAIRAALATDTMPPPLQQDARCNECSLIDLCQPHAEATLLGSYTILRAQLFTPDL